MAIRILCFVVAFSCAQAAVWAQTQAQTQQPTPSRQQEQDRPAFARTLQNTFEFDHLRMTSPQEGLAVLRVGDGEYFQVLFTYTDPRKFRYAVTVTEDDALREASFAAGREIRTERTNLTSARVTMRHDATFRRYRVSATMLEGVNPVGGQPQDGSDRAPVTESRPGTPPPATSQPDLVNLHEVAFDLWVETAPGWQLSFSGGTAFSSLTNSRFFIRTDTKTTVTADDDVKTVEVDPAGDDFRPDIVAIANLSHPSWKGFGVSFGVGLNNDADPRYFLGPSVMIGNRFILHGGWAGGKVAALPAGQEIGKSPVAGDNTLGGGTTRFKNSVFVGIAFTFVERDDQFKGAFSGTSTSRAPQPPSGEPPADDPDGAAQGAAAQRDSFVGIYTTADDTRIEVAKVADDGIVVTVADQMPVAFTAANRQGLVWSREVDAAGGSKEQARVTFSRTGNTVSGLEYRRGAVVLTATRPAQ